MVGLVGRYMPVILATQEVEAGRSVSSRPAWTSRPAGTRALCSLKGDLKVSEWGRVQKKEKETPDLRVDSMK